MRGTNKNGTISGDCIQACKIEFGIGIRSGSRRRRRRRHSCSRRSCSSHCQSHQGGGPRRRCGRSSPQGSVRPRRRAFGKGEQTTQPTTQRHPPKERECCLSCRGRVQHPAHARGRPPSAPATSGPRRRRRVQPVVPGGAPARRRPARTGGMVAGLGSPGDHVESRAAGRRPPCGGRA